MARTQSIPVVSAEAARTLLMDAQGLLQRTDQPATSRRVYSLIERMGFVQLDTITVVERAHHHILFTRLDRYRPGVLERLHHDERLLFEHMTHDASLIPVKWFPQWRHRFSRPHSNAWLRQKLGEDPGRVIAEVRERIRRDGEGMAKSFERDGQAPAGAWWEWRPQKAALEYLWRTGELSVVRRVNFHKVYDLTERVHSSTAAEPRPTREEHVDWACRSAIERLGVATSGEVRAFWNAVKPAEAAAWCKGACASGEIVPVMVESCDGAPPRRAYAVAVWRERVRRTPPPPEQVRLLSPFDPVVRDRNRVLRLFNFHYRFEAFVPAPKRRYGYYVLPILRGDRLVGRLDPKLDRRNGVLEIRRVWWEDGVRESRKLREELAEGVEKFAAFCGAMAVRMSPKGR